MAQELNELQKQNNELARAVERATKAKCAAEEECYKLAHSASDDGNLQILCDQLQSQLTSAHRVSEQHRMRTELLEGRQGQLEKDLLQSTDTRRHEGSEAERRLQITTKECEQERSRGTSLSSEVDGLRTEMERLVAAVPNPFDCDLAPLARARFLRPCLCLSGLAWRTALTWQCVHAVLLWTRRLRKELHVAQQEKEVQVGLIKKEMDMCSAECQSKVDIKADVCERTLTDFRRLMTEQQRKAAHRVEELRVSVMRLERERDTLRQDLTYKRDAAESSASELLRIQKDKQTLSRQASQLKSRLDTVEKNAYSEEDRANAAEMQVVDLLSKQETILSELSMARQARDQSELDARKSRRSQTRLETRLKETEARLNASVEKSMTVTSHTSRASPTSSSYSSFNASNRVFTSKVSA